MPLSTQLGDEFSNAMEGALLQVLLLLLLPRPRPADALPQRLPTGFAAGETPVVLAAAVTLLVSTPALVNRACEAAPLVVRCLHSP